MNKASTPEERRGYEDSVKTYRDIDNAIATAEKDTHAEGRAEGMVEANLESARRMKADGMTPDLIARYTGVTTEEIEKL